MYHDEHSGLHGFLQQLFSRIQKIFVSPDGRLRPFLRAILFLFLGLVLANLAQGAARGLAAGLPQLARIVIGYLIVDAVFLLETWFFLSVFDHRSFRTLGLWFYPRWGGELVLGIVLGAALIAVVVGGLVGSGLVSYHGLGEGSRDYGFAALGGMLFLAAAFEELATRGYAFQRLIESITPLGAVLVFSALFGAGHLGNPHVNPLAVANTVLAGVLLSLVYLKTRALWLPIGLHWAWNFLLGPVFGLPVSGFTRVFQPFLLKGQVAGPEWLTGSTYGPEGSILLTVACVAAIVWLARTKSVFPSPAMGEVLK